MTNIWPSLTSLTFKFIGLKLDGDWTTGGAGVIKFLGKLLSFLNLN